MERPNRLLHQSTVCFWPLFYRKERLSIAHFPHLQQQQHVNRCRQSKPEPKHQPHHPLTSSLQQSGVFLCEEQHWLMVYHHLTQTELSAGISWKWLITDMVGRYICMFDFHFYLHFLCFLFGVICNHFISNFDMKLLINHVLRHWLRLHIQTAELVFLVRFSLFSCSLWGWGFTRVRGQIKGGQQ